MSGRSAKYTGKAPPADLEGRTQVDVNRAAMRMGLARKRAAKRTATETPPPAPLPPFLCGDTSGLPKAPPGRKTS